MTKSPSAGSGSGAGVQSRYVAASEADMRLDRWFKRHFPALPHVRLQKLMRSGQVRVDGKRVEASTRLLEGQTVRIPPLSQEALEPARPNKTAQTKVSKALIQNLEDSILHFDKDIIIINKPYGLAVQGGTNTAVHLDAALDELRFGYEERPRLIHRLDKETSGVLVLGRTLEATRLLNDAFRDHRTRKYYWAVTVGVPDPRKGTIDAALAKGGETLEKMAVDEELGKPALTFYSTVRHSADREASWMALWPVTGRTHQLRAHLSLIGTPILGDGKYGQRDTADLPRRLHLFARRLILPHPRGGIVDVSAPMPEHFQTTFAHFGFRGEDDGDPFRKITT